MVVKIKKQVEFCSKRLFSYITKSPSNNVSVSSLPISLIIEDENKVHHPVELIHILPFSSLEVIPEILAQHAEGCSSDAAFKLIKERTAVHSPSELCYYLYKSTHHVHS